ncbi:MAG: hypothetical protein JXQ73_00140 [Phycisphaerae bacterium]|nr:hypothetical protein [Phycisphaerae bacterium]
MEIGVLRASEEAAGGGEIEDAIGPDQVLDGLGVLEAGDVLDALIIDVEVVHVGQDVVGLAMGHVELEQVGQSVNVAVDAEPRGLIVGEGESAVRGDLAALLCPEGACRLRKTGPGRLSSGQSSGWS